MIDLGLSSADQLKFSELMYRPHWVYTRVQILDKSHNYLGDVSNLLMDGQVNIDITADISRSLDMDILDPGNTLGFDPNDPTSGSMFLDKMIRVYYCIMPPDKSASYNTPIFTGPISRLDRNGSILKVQGLGKESLADSAMRAGVSYTKNWLKTDIIRDIMERAGETKFDFAVSTAKTPDVLSTNRESIPWQAANQLAQGLGMVLFYDGRGTCVLRRQTSVPVWNFDGRYVLTPPQPGFSLDDVFNDVYVIGSKPKGAKRQVTARATAPSTSPLSPIALGRNNTPYYLTLTIEDSSIRTTAKAQQVANDNLQANLLQSIDLVFETMPVPHLEEYDTYTYTSPTYADTSTVRTLSIPLSAAGKMSIGALRRVTPNRTTFQKR